MSESDEISHDVVNVDVSLNLNQSFLVFANYNLLIDVMIGHSVVQNVLL